jgi:cell division protein FtsB
MNNIGKILVVLIFVMSIVWMTVTMMVYATHTNWRQVVEGGGEKPGLRQEVQRLKKENEELQAQKEKLESQHKEEIAAKADAIVKLESQKKAVTDENAQLVKERDELSRKEREAVAAVDSSSKNEEKLTIEVKGLREENRKLQEDRDGQFAKVVKLTDDIHKSQQELARTTERRDQLVAQVEHARKLLHPFKLGIDSPLDRSPPALHGKVLAINDEKMVEISLGSDDGIAVGHTVDVSRGNKYVGRLVVITTATDKAVAKIDTKYTKTAVQTGDDVATHLRVTAEGQQNGKARL